MYSISQSPLLQKIEAALAELDSSDNGISISITAHPVEEEDGDGKVEVKWLCWNIIGPDDEYLTEPLLAVVHKDLTEEKIAGDLQKLFPARRFIVDNDIYFEED